MPDRFHRYLHRDSGGQSIIHDYRRTADQPSGRQDLPILLTPFTDVSFDLLRLVIDLFLRDLIPLNNILIEGLSPVFRDGSQAALRIHGQGQLAADQHLQIGFERSGDLNTQRDPSIGDGQDNRPPAGIFRKQSRELAPRLPAVGEEDSSFRKFRLSLLGAARLAAAAIYSVRRRKTKSNGAD